MPLVVGRIGQVVRESTILNELTNDLVIRPLRVISLLTMAHLRSRRTLAAWLAVEGFFSPIAHNGRRFPKKTRARPWFAIWSWQRLLRTVQSVLRTYAIRLTRLKQIRRERKTPQPQP